MDDILNVKNLTKNYKDFSLKDISFSIPKGCIMGLVGENGAGKTTTIKLILNLIKKNQGGIQVFGLDHIESELQIKDRIGVVLDECYFHDNLTPIDISKITGNIYSKWNRELFLSYLERFKLPRDKVVKDFSKGMRMKLAIAVALSHEPELLILDEPTGGLDPIVRNEILDMFLEFIQDEKKSILFSTHITSDLDKIGDYITFIHKGEVILSKSKDELLNDYGLIKCGASDFDTIRKDDIAGYRKNQFGYEVLIDNKRGAGNQYRHLAMDPVSLEDIMLYHIKGER